MTHERRIVESIDACRPGRDDTVDPDLAFLAAELSRNPSAREFYERVQRVDVGISSAMKDVGVPAGLEARLLERLGLAAGQTSDVRVSEAISDMPPTDTAAPKVRPVSRRRWLLAAAVVGIAASIAVFVSISREPVVTTDNLADVAREFFERDREQSTLGRLASVEPPPAGFPLGSAIRIPGSIRWRQVSGFVGARGIGYDLLPPGGTGPVRASLYVVRIPSTLTRLGISPPVAPLSSTGGLAIGAWQSNGLLYVLVVNGGVQQYQELIRPAPNLT